MKFGKALISAQTQQPSVPEPDASVDSRHLSGPVPATSSPVTWLEQPGIADQPFVARPVKLGDDAFSCPPQIYDPDANFIVDSAQNDLGSEYHTPIGPCEGSDPVPESFNPTVAKLHALEKSRQAICARFNAKIEHIDEQISRLQAIEHPPPEGGPHD